MSHESRRASESSGDIPTLLGAFRSRSDGARSRPPETLRGAVAGPRGVENSCVVASRVDSEECPSTWDAFEFVFAVVSERVLGGTEEIGDGP